jgi:hypothetical protein
MQKCLNLRAELPIERWLGFFYWRKGGEMKKLPIFLLVFIILSPTTVFAQILFDNGSLSGSQEFRSNWAE